jgi:hypothetical protein
LTRILLIRKPSFNILLKERESGREAKSGAKSGCKRMDDAYHPHVVPSRQRSKRAA